MVQQRRLANNLKTIRSEELRELLLRVCDDVGQLAPLLWYIKDLSRAEDACRWLIKSHLTGMNLYHVWQKQFEGSYLSVIQLINQGLEKSDKVRAVSLGRDLKR